MSLLISNGFFEWQHVVAHVPCSNAQFYHQLQEAFLNFYDLMSNLPADRPVEKFMDPQMKSSENRLMHGQVLNCFNLSLMTELTRNNQF